MKAILFSLKRADQCSRALQRRLLNPFGITPARYDLLFVMFQNHVHRRSPWMFQSRIRKELGVKAPTVSVMTRELATLGFVTRKRQRFGDKRQVIVTMTKRAFNVLRNVRKRVIQPGFLWLALCTAMGSPEKMGSLEFYTNLFRTGMKDPALFIFPEQRERTVTADTPR
jgi:DNA-binding MarR family transcriptional regulator